MRRVSLFAAVLIVFAATSAGAVDEAEVGFAAEGGLAHLIGDLGDDARDNVAFGVNMSYGALDWLAAELGGIYSIHTEQNKDRVGDLRLDLVNVYAGPRFKLDLAMVELWVSAGVGATVYRADVSWRDANDDKIKDDESGAAPNVTGAAGVDIELADIVAIGVHGRLIYGLAEMDYRTPREHREVPPIIALPMLRASLRF